MDAPRILTTVPEAVAFGRGRVRALREAGFTDITRNYDTPWGRIRVKILGDYAEISSDGEAGYEFFATEPLYVLDPLGVGDFGAAPGTAGYSGPSGTAVLGAGVALVGGGRARARFANGGALVGLGGWPLRDRPINVHREGENWQPRKPMRPMAEGELFTEWAWGYAGFQQYHWWPENKPGRVVVSVGATGRGRTWTNGGWVPKWYAAGVIPFQVLPSVDVASPTGREVTGSSTQRYLVDDPAGKVPRALVWAAPSRLYERENAFDIRPVALGRGGMALGGHKRTPQANWRHAAIITARSPAGRTREFFVSTDTHGVFTFYPARDWMQAWINAGRPDEWAPDELLDALVQVVRPAYPSWVTVTPDSQSTTDDHWQWSFNRSATRAASTPLAKKPSHAWVLLRMTDFGPVLESSADRAGQRTPIALLGTAEAQFSAAHELRRVPVYQLKRGRTVDDSAWRAAAEARTPIWGANAVNSDYALEINGKLVPLSGCYEILLNTVAGLDADAYEQGVTTTPGFVEVAISVDISDFSDDFTARVEVLDHEPYSQHRRFYMDTAYYVRTPRTKGLIDEPEDDELLTGEIEIYWADRGKEFAGRTGEFMDTDPNPGLKDDNDLRPPRLSVRPFPARMEDYRDTDDVEGLLVGGYCGMRLYAYYAVRERRTGRLVKRLCLAHDADWQAFELNWRTFGRRRKWFQVFANGRRAVWRQDDSTPAQFTGCVDQAELRFLSFLTRSYCTASYTDPDFATISGAHHKYWHPEVRPRFELRIHGQPLQTIDYSLPEAAGFTELGADPMADLATPPTDAVKLPHEPSARGFTLAMQQWLAAQCFPIVHDACFAFSPAGHYSVYAARRAVDMPLNAASTETSGVFDVVYDHGTRKRTTHKDLVNKAFDRALTYSVYDPAQGDMGGFATSGIWLKP